MAMLNNKMVDLKPPNRKKKELTAAPGCPLQNSHSFHILIWLRPQET
jgi:hypothetical protein